MDVKHTRILTASANSYRKHARNNTFLSNHVRDLKKKEKKRKEKIRKEKLRKDVDCMFSVFDGAVINFPFIIASSRFVWSRLVSFRSVSPQEIARLQTINFLLALLSTCKHFGVLVGRGTS